MQMTFISTTQDIPLLTPVLSDKGVRRLRLVNEWKVYIDGNKDKYIIVPAGSETNFATIPWFLRWALSQTDPVLVLPAIAHDYLVKEFDPTAINPVIYSEKLFGSIVDHEVDWFEAAKVFQYLIRGYKGKSVMIKSNLAYAGVWLNGHLRKI